MNAAEEGELLLCRSRRAMGVMWRKRVSPRVGGGWKTVEKRKNLLFFLSFSFIFFFLFFLFVF